MSSIRLRKCSALYFLKSMKNSVRKIFIFGGRMLNRGLYLLKFAQKIGQVINSLNQQCHWKYKAPRVFTGPNILLNWSTYIWFLMQAKKYKELISNILKFTGLLVEHSYARHIYSSMEVHMCSEYVTFIVS